MLAHAYYKEKDWQQAISYYQQAMQLSQNPEDISIYQAKIQKAFLGCSRRD
jgi:tetratricopeptide (TPR) repeat protein